VTSTIALLGHPVSHSISPRFQQAALDALGIDARYEAWDTPPEDLPSALERLRSRDLLGANVTVPLKQEALRLIDRPDALAERIGAVNTIVNAGGVLEATNTDVAGVLRSLEDGGVDLAGANVVLIGAGGAARAIVVAMREGGAARDHDADSGDAFEALVGRCHQRVEGNLAGVQRDGAEGAHGVDQQAAAVPGCDLGDGLDGVEDARRGLAMDRQHVGDVGVPGQRRVDVGGRHRGVLRGFQGHVVAPQVLQDFGHALPVGAVDEDQGLAAARDEGPQRRLDGEGAAALHGHADVGALGPGDGHQTLAHPGISGDELRIARAPVVEHGFLGPGRGGQRPRGEQIGIGLGSRHG